ncbi:DUF6442 family protein [Ruminococcus sp.]|uniref:DUF6442 family protein n=1 Tax=Ruminococcus sp. TaxID=41978 RepID=UPI0025ED4725|nr:DUF6442 family protein [Ruminococcus sp.]MBQ6168843.1 hypothetical protein [Ruminococcus sp.]MBR1429700.1 hypothetical protein [Ruminococcus sp.]
MNREEILAKSRQENKNRDIAEIDRARSASRFAMLFSLCFIGIYTMLSLFASSRVNYGMIATEFCMIFAMHLHRAIKSRTSADIAVAALNGLAFAMFTFMAVCELFGLKP